MKADGFRFLDSADLKGRDFSNERTCLREIAYQLKRIADKMEARR